MKGMKIMKEKAYRGSPLSKSRNTKKMEIARFFYNVRWSNIFMEKIYSISWDKPPLIYRINLKTTANLV